MFLEKLIVVNRQLFLMVACVYIDSNIANIIIEKSIQCDFTVKYFFQK